jgi:hypothetical protein
MSTPPSANCGARSLARTMFALQRAARQTLIQTATVQWSPASSRR